MIRKILEKTFRGWQKRVIIIYPTSLVIFLALNLAVIQKLVGPKAVFSGQKIGESGYLGAPFWWWKSEVINDCLNGCVPKIDVTIDTYRLLWSLAIIIVVCRLIYSIIQILHKRRISRKIAKVVQDNQEEVIVFKGFKVEADDKKNDLSIRLEVSDGSRSPAFNENVVSICIDMYINNKRISNNLDIDKVFNTLDQEGLLPLFTCGCGCFGCGGNYIGVSLKSDSMKLKNSYSPNDKQELNEQFEYTISTDVWYRLLKKLLHKIELEVIDNKINHLIVGVIGVNICDNIKTYEYNLGKAMSKNNN